MSVRPLQRDGWHVSAARESFPATFRRRLLAELDAHPYAAAPGARRWRLFGGRGWLRPKGLEPRTAAEIRRLVERYTDGLELLLRGERFRLGDVELRRVVRGPCFVTEPHLDGGWVTLSVTMRGPGTSLYRRAGSRAVVVRTGEGGVLVSNRDREVALGVSAAMHSAPAGQVRERVVLLVVYRTAGRVPSGPAAAKAREAMHARTVWFGERIGRPA